MDTKSFAETIGELILMEIDEINNIKYISQIGSEVKIQVKFESGKKFVLTFEEI